jgi:hypothetical protein
MTERTPESATDSFFGAVTTTVFVDETTEPATAGDGGGNQADSDDELDSEFVPQPRRRIGALTIALAALLVAGAGFLAGVQVQQHQGSAGTATDSNAFARRGGTGGGGTGGGGFSGFGAGAGSGTGADAGSGAGAVAGTAGPVVIGQIVSVTGDTVVVRNLGGKEVTVKLSSDTTITQTAKVSDLKAGQTVSVSGSTAADGSVTATAVGTR